MTTKSTDLFEGLTEEELEMPEKLSEWKSHCEKWAIERREKARLRECLTGVAEEVDEKIKLVEERLDFERRHVDRDMARCRCDDFTDLPCPVHDSENMLQDAVLWLRKVRSDLLAACEKLVALRIGASTAEISAAIDDGVAAIKKAKGE